VHVHHKLPLRGPVAVGDEPDGDGPFGTITNPLRCQMGSVSSTLRWPYLQAHKARTVSVAIILIADDILMSGGCSGSPSNPVTVLEAADGG